MVRSLCIIRGKVRIGRLVLKIGYKGGIIIRAFIRSVSTYSALDFVHVHNHAYSCDMYNLIILIIYT